MKLSIITINYNNVEGLSKTIESVLQQDSTEFEYIVIDGGSTDGSLDLILKNKEKITYWVSEKDKGIYHAMNKGILASKGEYCQFLNSGDYLASPNVTTRMLRSLDGASIFYGNMVKVWPNGKRYKNLSIDHQSFYPFYFGALNHSPAYIKRKLFDVYGLYDENLKIVSDWKFYLKSVGLANESLKYIDIDVTVFDMTGISNTNYELDKVERRLVLKEYLPENIINDYDKYWQDIEMMKRLKRYNFVYKIVWLIERMIFKFEKKFKKTV